MVNVLCIDNSDTIRKVVQDCVKDLGYKFFEAKGSYEGINLVKNVPFNLIILDWNMPKIDGKGTLKQLREIENLNDTLIMVMIPVEQKDDVIKAVSLGANSYILKPFPVSKMQDKIKNVVEGAE